MIDTNLIPIIVFIIWIIGAVILLATFNKPSKKIIIKYGEPLELFSVHKCCFSLPKKGTYYHVYMYTDFVLLVDEHKKEIVIPKSFKDFTVMKPQLYIPLFFPKVFEFKHEDKILQMTVTDKQEKLLKDYFDYKEEEY